MRYWPQRCFIISAILLFGLLTSCTKHEVDVKPVEIKPIHITIDVNVKVDRALDAIAERLDELVDPAIFDLS